MLIDTHCHLTHKRFAEDIEAVLNKAKDAGVERCITIGTGIEDSHEALALAQRFPEAISATMGIDPFSAFELKEGFNDACEQLAALIGAGGYCGVGEIGLDYHYELGSRLSNSDPCGGACGRLRAPG